MIVTMKNDKVYDSYEVDISFITTKPQLSKIKSLRPERKQRFYGGNLVAGGDVIKASDVKSIKMSKEEMAKTVSRMPSRKHDIFHASRKGGWSFNRKWKHTHMLIDQKKIDQKKKVKK